MPTELEELVEFLHHGNTQIRQIAVENLVPYSKTQPNIFKTGQCAPVKDLKLLVRDYVSISQNVLTILINISSDPEILKLLAEDDAFLETLLARVTSPTEPTANALSTFLANLAKSPSLSRLIPLHRPKVPALSPSPRAITQLTTLFNRGANGSYNKDANYDYLAYLFADLAKYPSFTTYLTTPTPGPTPLTIFLPQTTHPSPPRRLGAALLLKNTSHNLPHPPLPLPLLLPSLLLPLCAPDQTGISAEEMELLPPECQFLGDDHVPEGDAGVVGVLVEVLGVLAGKRGGRRGLVGGGAYVVVRELHVRWGDEGVRGAVEGLVDVLMGEEGGDEEEEEGGIVRVF